MPDDYRDMNNKVAVTDVRCDTHARYLLYSILIERVRCNTTSVSVYTSGGLAMIYGLIEKCSGSGSLKYNLQALYTVYIFRHTPKFHCNPCNVLEKTTENLINHFFYGSGSRTRLNFSKSFLSVRIGPKRNLCPKFHCCLYSGFGKTRSITTCSRDQDREPD